MKGVPLASHLIGAFLIAGIIALPAQGQPNFKHARSLFYQGQWQEAIQQFQKLLPHFPKAGRLTTEERQAIRYLAQAQWELGLSEQAIQSLEALIKTSQNQLQPQELGHILTQQAQYLAKIGNSNQALRLLCSPAFSSVENCESQSALALALTHQDRSGTIAALGSLATVLVQNSNTAVAHRLLEEALQLSNQIPSQPYQLPLIHTLGQVYLRQGERDQTYAKLAEQANNPSLANNFYQRSQAAFQSARETLQTGYDRLSISDITPLHLELTNQLIRTYQAQEKRPPSQLLNQGQTWLTHLPLSQSKLYLASHFTQLRFQSTQSMKVPTSPQRPSWFSCVPARNREAFQSEIKYIQTMAKKLQHLDVEAYSLGTLGRLNLCRKEWRKAQALTEQAIFLLEKPELRYQWEWQLGRILREQGQIKQAIIAYQQAVFSMNRVRRDLVVANRDFKLDLQAQVEGLYRELVDLQFRQLSKSNLQQGIIIPNTVLTNLDQLRIAELQNYLLDDCGFPELTPSTTTLSSETAIIRTVIFENRMAITLTLRDKHRKLLSKLFWVNQSASQINNLVNQFRIYLERRSDLSQKYLSQSQILYDWIIRPIYSDLTSNNIENLIFIHDGLLRSIPMAALHDGQFFLIENYAIGNSTYGLQSNPITHNNREYSVAAFGLTKTSTISQYSQLLNLNSLPGVENELNGIQTNISNSQINLNQKFSMQNLRDTLQNFSPSIVHLATHARFGIDPRDTFLVTGQKQLSEPRFNETINLPTLFELLQNLPSKLTLLFITGCETAVGNERDILGISGIALQAGVDTVIASLWQLDDLATGEITPTFYKFLNEGYSKAEALQLAQKSWLKSHRGTRRIHPGFWAPLILVGDWQ